MATDPNQWETYTWGGKSAGALPADMSSDEWDNPTAEPSEDINAQLMDLASDSERQAVYLAPDQKEDRNKNPLGSVVIEDFDGKGGKLIARDQEVADKALAAQTSGRSNQEIIGALTLAGDGKPSNPDALVVQKMTPDGAVMRESVQATPGEAEAKGNEWGGGGDINFTDMPSAIKRREDLIRRAAGGEGLNAQLVANVMSQESAGDRYAESGAGAQGLMQLMPGTAKDMGVTDVWNEEQNARGGAKYLALMKKKYDGDRDKMLAAYNWGPGNLDKHLASLPQGADWKEGLPAETADYLKKVSVGGTSEALAVDIGLASSRSGGFAIPTDESIAGAVDTVFDKNIPYLADDPVLGQLDWQDAQQRQGGGDGQQVDDSDQWEVYKTANVSPEEYAEDPTWEDYGRMLMSGGASMGAGIGWLIKKIGAEELGGAIQETSSDAVHWWLEGLSPQAKKAMETQFLERDNGELWTSNKWNRAKLQTFQSLLGTAAGMGVGSLLTKGLGAVGMTRAATTAAGQAVQIPSKTAGAIGYGIGEASVAAPMAGAGSEAQVRDLTHEQLMEQSIEYRAFYDLGDPALSDEERQANALDIVAKAVGNDAAAMTALTTFMLSAPAGAYLSKMLGGSRIAEGGGRIAGTARGAGAETLQEFGQSGAERLSQNVAMRETGGFEDQDLSEGVLEEAVGGALSGTMMGATTGFAQSPSAPKDDASPADDTPKPKPKVKRNPDGSWSEVEGTTDEPVPASALDAEAEDIPGTPPESETATTSPTPTDETAPTKAQEEASSEVVEETPVEELLAAAANAEEAADQEEVESPVLTAKEMAPLLQATITAQKEAKPVRDAWRGLVNALNERYSDANLTAPKGAFGGKGLAKFFQSLQEEVDLTQDIPEIKELLTQISGQEDVADIINVLDRLAGKVRDETPSLGVTGDTGGVAGQVQNEYNNFVPWFKKHRGESTAKATKGQANLKGTPKRIFAERLGQFAGAVRNLLKAAEEAGVISMEGSGLGATYGASLDAADRAMSDAMSPQEKKTKLKSGEAGKAKTIAWRSDSLVGIADDVVAIAENLVPKLAEAEAKAAALTEERFQQMAAEDAKPTKKAKPKPKVAETTPVTKAPAKPKKAAKAAKTSKAKAEKKAAPEKPTGDTRSYNDLRRRAKELGITTTGKKAEVLARVQEAEKNPDAENAVEAAKEKKKEAERQKKLVPARYRGKKYYFHAVRNDEDIDGILADGLKPGTNVSRLGGQALEASEGGFTVLVFEGETAGQKEYQEDELAAGGEKPIAIIKDTSSEEREAGTGDAAGTAYEQWQDGVADLAENWGKEPGEIFTAIGTADLKKNKELRAEGWTVAQIAKLRKLEREQQKLFDAASSADTSAVTAEDVLQKYRKYLLPTYSTTGVKVKPDVAGASPNAVLAPEAVPLKGSGSRETAKIVGAENIEAALEQVGVKKDTAALINGLQQVVSKEQWSKITDAIYDFIKTKDPIRLYALVQESVEGRASDDIVKGIHEVALAFEEQAEIRRAALEQEAAGEEEQYSEDERELLGLTGQSFENEDEDNPVDQWNVPYGERLRSLYDLLGGQLLGKSKAVSKADANILQRAFDKLRPKLDGIETVKMGAFIDMMLEVLPSNHRFSHLLQQIKKSGLELNVDIVSREDEIVLDAEGKERSKGGGSFTPDYASPEDSSVEILTNKDRSGKVFFRTATHELLHAVTVFRYATDTLFRNRIDALWKKSVLKLLSNSAAFDPAVFDDLTRDNSSGAYDYVLEFLMSEPGDVGPATINALYGLTSPKEFMAEAFTNLEFQEVLAGIESEPHGNLKFMASAKSFLKVFINELKKMLDMSIRNTVLEEVLILSANNFDTAASYNQAAGNVALQDALRERKLKRPRAAGPPTFEDKYNDTSLTGLVSKALALKTRAKEILKAARAAQANIKEGQPPTEVDDIVTRTGRDIRQAKKAIEMLSIGLEAADNGRRHVIQDHLERAESYLSRTSQKETLQSVQIEEDSVPDKKVRSSVVNNAADAARGRDNYIRDSVQNLAQILKDLPAQTNLGFMALDQLERKYRSLFAKAAKAAGQLTSPLTRYIKAKQAASVLAREYAERSAAIFRKVQKLDNKGRAKMFKMALEATLAEVWPHVSLKHPLNNHLWGKPHKTTGTRKLSPKLGKAALQARKDYEALKEENPQAAALLLEMAALTKEIQDARRAKTLRLVAQTHELEGTLADRLSAVTTPEEIQKLFKSVYDAQGDIADKGEYPADMIADKDKDSKEEKQKKKDARSEYDQLRGIARAAEEIVNNHSVRGPYFPLRRYGPIVVASTEAWNEDNEPYVSFHNNKWEARRVKAKLKKEFDMDTNIARKIESTALSSDAKAVVAELKSRIFDPQGAGGGIHARIDTALLEIMAENTAHSSALKRHGIDGVSSDDMGRAFEEYIHVSQYTLGDLETTFEMSEAFKELRQLQAAGEEISDADRDTIGMVVNELAEQNKEDARDREMSTMQRAIGTIGFFNFLGAPSYWILNATQTLTVTLPYIGGKWGLKGNTAYKDAAAMIYRAAKGAKSYEQFKKRLPPAAQLVVQRMEDEGIIQSTIAHEFGDMLSPTTLTKLVEKTGVIGSAATTGLMLMEKIPETVEKYNRIVTALAIYDLSGGDMVEVADGVQATQFNYDSVNRARLLKAAPKWAGGGLRALITPIMMFKTYGIGIMRLLYGNAIRGVMGDTAAERSEARRIAGGLIVSHTFFGGIAGGVMLAPVQMLVSVFNEVFREAGDEFDPEEAVQLFLEKNSSDMVAALATRGVPAALGVDMSKSINLGNLLWMGNDRINFADAGGVETGIVTALGPVAQYGVTSVREGMRLWNEDPRGNWYDFAAAAIPLKMARGTIRGAKYEFEGVGTDTLTWMTPENVSGWVRMAMGFRPTKLSTLTDFEYNTLAREGRRSERKSQLIARALAATPAEKAEIWKEIDSFNRSLEKRGDWINRGDVARLRSHRRSRQRDYNRDRR